MQPLKQFFRRNPFAIFALLPLLNLLLKMGPPPIAGVSIITLGLNFIAIIATLHFAGGSSRRKISIWMTMLLVVFCAALIATARLQVKFVANTYPGRDPVIKGWVLKDDDVRKLISMGVTEEKALRENEFDPQTIWTQQSIYEASIALYAGWAATWISVSIFMTLFFLLQRRHHPVFKLDVKDTSDITVSRDERLSAQSEPFDMRAPEGVAARDSAPGGKRTQVFISYSHADNESENPAHRWLDRLLKHLTPLVSQDDLCVWSDRQIEIGADWQSEVACELNSAKAAILLVSPSFLASPFIRDSEVPVLLRRAADEGLVILPVIVRPCLISAVRFRFRHPQNGPTEFNLSNLLTANPPTRSLLEMDEAEQDRVFVSVAQRLLKIT